jgi:hypothetical protein
MSSRNIQNFHPVVAASKQNHGAARRGRIALPSTVVLGALGLGWTISGGLVSCDSTARFSLNDTKFDRVRVVSAFPAVVGKDGTLKRVCGAPLEGEEAVQPNGLELTVNMVSTELVSPKCDRDTDRGIRDGERVEQQLVTTNPDFRTVSPTQFQLQIECMEQRVGMGDSSTCNSSATEASPVAQAVAYKANAPRCNPDKPETYQNVAILVDHSGSTSGLVVTGLDGQGKPVSCAAANKFVEDTPGFLPADNLSACMSDPFFVRITEVQGLIDQLNSKDRVVTMFFDEKNGVQVGCVDALHCQRTNESGVLEVCNGNSEEQCEGRNVACKSKDDCAKAGLSAEYDCDVDPDFKNTSTYVTMSPEEALKNCFGNSAAKKAENKYGIAAWAKYEGQGRAPTYESINVAYDFLQKQSGLAANQPKHIVLITDGPDTCVETENFTYVDPSGKSGKCRNACVTANTKFKDLLQNMAQDGFPVRVHVIQMQSKGYDQPDATLQELACRSEGTYQFLNSNDYNSSDPDEYNTMARAITAVRHALGGTWRVGFPDNRIGPDPTPVVPHGQMTALRATFKFSNPLFESLGAVYSNPIDPDDWQLTQLGRSDRRMVFRTACTSNADCGGEGEDPCAAPHCRADGVCSEVLAPDLTPCGADGSQVCCKGTCQSSCDGVCKK